MHKVKDFRKPKHLSSEQQEELEDHLGIPADDVGKTANKLNIRINKCLLDCF
jgi:hypothetical protein